MTDWLRLWHDMPTDPKWRVIARKSGQPLACVIAVFNLVLVNASTNAANRGTLAGWDDEDAAAALDMDPEAVAAIMAAMQGKVIDGARLTGWERRQPKREDGTAAERKQAWKDRQAEAKNAAERGGTHGNAAERAREDTEKSRGDQKSDRSSHLSGSFAASPSKAAKPFPADGSIFYSPYAAISRRVKPNVDPDVIANAFRSFCHSQAPPIPFDDPRIERRFEGFARNHQIRGH